MTKTDQIHIRDTISRPNERHLPSFLQPFDAWTRELSNKLRLVDEAIKELQNVSGDVTAVQQAPSIVQVFSSGGGGTNTVAAPGVQALTFEFTATGAQVGSLDPIVLGSVPGPCKVLLMYGEVTVGSLFKYNVGTEDDTDFWTNLITATAGTRAAQYFPGGNLPPGHELPGTTPVVIHPSIPFSSGDTLALEVMYLPI